MTYSLLLALSISLACTLPLTSTPLTLGAWVLSLAVVFSLITATSVASWFGLILFIIYISGMLVMFSYFTAITPNQQMPMSTTIYSLIITIILSSIYFSSHTTLPTSSTFSLNSNKAQSLTYMYSNYQTPTLILLAILLLLVLILAVKIVEHKKGPLRPFF